MHAFRTAPRRAFHYLSCSERDFRCDCACSYFFAKSDRPTKVVLTIEAWDATATSKVLATTTVLVGGGGASSGGEDGGWEMHNFSLTPTATTECSGLVPDSAAAKAVNITCPVNGTYDPTAPMSDRTAHVCVQCGGQFVSRSRKAIPHHALSRGASLHTTAFPCPRRAFPLFCR